MVFLIYVALLLAIGVFGLMVLQMMRGNRVEHDSQTSLPSGSSKSYDPDAGVGEQAASTLADFEATQSRIRAHYPVLARMLSGYLHAEALSKGEGLEGAVREMVLDWRPERESVITEITRVLAENPTEEAIRAVMLSICDAEFEQEGYRNWLIWLQGQFNDL